MPRYSRHRLDFNITGAGPGAGDTGPPIHGELMQVRWNPTVVDTGNNAVFRMDFKPREGDTGDGWTIATRATGMNANWFDVVRQPVTYGAFTDNSGDSGAAPIVFAGDRLRTKLLSTSPIAGRLYYWFRH